MPVTEEDLETGRRIARYLHRRLEWTELDELEGDAFEALPEAVREWEEIEPSVRGVRRSAWIMASIRPRVVDAIRGREGRRLKRREFRRDQVDIDGPADRPGESRPLAEVVADPRQDTFAQAAARIELERLLALSPRERAALVRRRRRKPLGQGVLSRRHLEVLEHAARGLSTKETAAELGLSAETVQTYRKQLTARLGANGITNAVHVAHLRGILGPQSNAAAAA